MGIFSSKDHDPAWAWPHEYGITFGLFLSDEAAKWLFPRVRAHQDLVDKQRSRRISAADRGVSPGAPETRRPVGLETPAPAGPAPPLPPTAAARSDAAQTALPADRAERSPRPAARQAPSNEQTAEAGAAGSADQPSRGGAGPTGDADADLASHLSKWQLYNEIRTRGLTVTKNQVPVGGEYEQFENLSSVLKRAFWDVAREK